jgi:hypothetical protein
MRTRVTNAIPFVQELSKAFGFLVGLTGKLSLQPSPIIAAIQLIKAASPNSILDGLPSLRSLTFGLIS